MHFTSCAENLGAEGKTFALKIFAAAQNLWMFSDDTMTFPCFMVNTPIGQELMIENIEMKYKE